MIFKLFDAPVYGFLLETHLLDHAINELLYLEILIKLLKKIYSQNMITIIQADFSVKANG